MKNLQGARLGVFLSLPGEQEPNFPDISGSGASRDSQEKGKLSASQLLMQPRGPGGTPIVSTRPPLSFLPVCVPTVLFIAQNYHYSTSV